MPVSDKGSARLIGASIGLFFLSLFLTSYTARRPEAARIGSIVLLEVFRPIQTGSTAAQSLVRNFWDRYVSVWEAQRENELLRARLKVLESDNARLREREHESARLRSLLNLVEEHEFKGVSATVVGYDPSNWVRAITISRGSLNGIEKGSAVLDSRGVVGQVIAVGPNSSRVLLITDPVSGLDAIIQTTRARGIVEGQGGDECEWRFVAAQEEVKVGDRVVTSGLDGVYPKGLVVGLVSRIDLRRGGLFRTAFMRPIVDFSKLETVFVVARDASIQGGDVAGKLHVDSEPAS